MRIKLGLTFVVFLIVFSVAPANAQQKGQWIPGQEGLNTGVLPDPGFTYVNITLNYSADTLKNANGNSVPLTGSYDIWAIENAFAYVPKFKLLGAKLMFAVVVTPANGSLTLGAINLPNVSVNGGGEGLADTWVQPVTLGWSLKRADVKVGYAFMAPTGRYTPGASDNIGSGYWGNHFLTGTTVYLTKNKGTTANLFTDWEFHGSKNIATGAKVTPGQAITTEWGGEEALLRLRRLRRAASAGDRQPGFRRQVHPAWRAVRRRHRRDGLPRGASAGRHKESRYQATPLGNSDQRQVSDGVDSSDRGSTQVRCRIIRFTPLDFSMRVPAMIRWPGKVPAGVVTNEMLAAVDWLPTLAGMAGASNLVPKDRPIDGVDASAFMLGKSDTTGRDS